MDSSAVAELFGAEFEMKRERPVKQLIMLLHITNNIIWNDSSISRSGNYFIMVT